jgi:hypothetical protein
MPTHTYAPTLGIRVTVTSRCKVIAEPRAGASAAAAKDPATIARPNDSAVWAFALNISKSCLIAVSVAISISPYSRPLGTIEDRRSNVTSATIVDLNIHVGAATGSG